MKLDLAKATKTIRRDTERATRNAQTLFGAYSTQTDDGLQALRNALTRPFRDIRKAMQKIAGERRQETGNGNPNAASAKRNPRTQAATQVDGLQAIRETRGRFTIELGSAADQRRSAQTPTRQAGAVGNGTAQRGIGFTAGTGTATRRRWQRLIVGANDPDNALFRNAREKDPLGFKRLADALKMPRLFNRPQPAAAGNRGIGGRRNNAPGNRNPNARGPRPRHHRNPAQQHRGGVVVPGISRHDARDTGNPTADASGLRQAIDNAHREATEQRRALRDAITQLERTAAEGVTGIARIGAELGVAADRLSIIRGARQ